jgi:hypothetical protein
MRPMMLPTSLNDMNACMLSRRVAGTAKKSVCSPRYTVEYTWPTTFTSVIPRSRVICSRRSPQTVDVATITSMSPKSAFAS